MAIQEWIRYIFKSPPQPWIYTILAIAVAVFCTLKIKKLLPLARSINQGRLLALRYLSALLPESNAGGKVRSPFQQVGNSAYGLD
jgi:hypothetical protein